MASADWVRNGTGMAPRIAWAFATDSELVSLTMARESGEIFAIDSTGGLYELARSGRVIGVNRGLHQPRIVKWSDNGEAGIVVEGADQVSVLLDHMRVAWTAGAPSTILDADIDAYGHNIALSLDHGETVLLNVDRQKLGQFSTLKPLNSIAFCCGEPKLIGAAEHGLVCCHDFDGNELWNERLWATVGSLSVTGDSKRIFLAEFAHGLQCLDSKGQNVAAYVVEGCPSKVSASFFGERVAVTTIEQQIYWLDADGTLLWAADSPSEIKTIICDPLGEWLILGLTSGRILKLDW